MIPEEQYIDRCIEATDLSRDGKLREAATVLQALPEAQTYSGWGHEKAISVTTLAEAYRKNGCLEEAAGALQWALRCAAAIEKGSSWEAADCYYNIGKLLIDWNRPHDALPCFRRAAALARTHQEGEINCLNVLGDVAMSLASMGKTSEAMEIAGEIRSLGIAQRVRAYIESLKRDQTQ
jgi:tetratricopeptide (TPR) repeat protein